MSDHRVVTREAAEEHIRRHYPHAQRIRFVDHGYDNVVAIVDDAHVFRFPRNTSGVKRLQFEAELLRHLAGKVTIAAIPRIAAVHAQPTYLISPYISGTHLTNQAVQALPLEAQTALGRRLAEFMVQLNQVVEGSAVSQMRQHSGLDQADESWAQFFERLFTRDPLPDERLRPFIAQCYPAWREQASREDATYAIHDDLHIANLLFKNTELCGVLDFGDANQGSIEEEMRVLYAMSHHVLQAALSRYAELTGTQISAERVRLWAVTQELASFIARLAKGETKHPTYLRGRYNLRQWLPTFPF